MGRAAIRLLCLGGLALALGAGCSRAAEEAALPELKGGVEIGLRRGSSWMTYTVKPPYVIGPVGSLRLHKGQMTGTVAGRQLNLNIETDRLSGNLATRDLAADRGLPLGGGGTIEIDIESGIDSVEVSGLWNGRRVHFTITPQELKGTIATVTEVGQCQYVLDKLDHKGNRTGISTCYGMPEETLIELPSLVQGWLTRGEMVSVLLALLSAPPHPRMEGFPGSFRR